MTRAEDGGATSRSIVRLTVAAAAAFSLLVALGTWQLQRMVWKRESIAMRAARLALPPLALSGPPAGVVAPAFRRIRATGVFLHDEELHLGPRALDGVPGYHVITPLRLAGGAIVLVDRGWVPLDRRDPATRARGQLTGRLEVEGRVRPAPRRGPFTPENQPEKGVWFTIDVAEMAAWLELREVLPFAVEAGPARTPGGLPKGAAFEVRLPDNHLQYAITWYALAAVLAVIYVLLVRGRRQRQ